MHLTPAFARGFRRTYSALSPFRQFIAIAMLAACARTTPVHAPSPPVQPAVLPPPVVSEPSPSRSTLLVPDSALYDVMSTVIGSDTEVSSAPRDSVIYREVVTSILSIGRDSSITITARSDSGYQLPRGRELPPEIVTRPRIPIRVSVQRDFRTQRLLNTSIAAECSSAATLVSPVMPTLVLQALMQTRKESRARRDSLSYSTCQAGVLVRYILHFSPDSAPTTPSADDLFRYTITGTLAADSSRTLPMRMNGRISGDAQLTGFRNSRPLPGKVTIRLQSDLIFESAARTQRLQQLVTTIFAARD